MEKKFRTVAISAFAIALFGLIVLLFGCSGLDGVISKPPNDINELQAKYCGGQPSVILNIFGDPMAEDVLLKTANCALLQYDVYSAKKARAILDVCKKYLSREDNTISGADVFKFACDQIEDLKKVIGPAQPILILSTLAPRINVPDILTPCDKKLLLAHIEHQMDVIDLCENMTAEEAKQADKLNTAD